MAENLNIFKGIKQVKYESFSGLSTEDKIGYLWFVRKEQEPDKCFIYFGSRCYGSYEQDQIEGIEEQVSGLTQDVEKLESNLELLGETLNEYKIKSINENGLLSLDNEGVLDTLFSGLKYDSETKKLGLADKEGNIIDSTSFDASDFVKDSFLSGVTYNPETKIMNFVWHVDSDGNGETPSSSTTPVDLNGLVDAYSAKVNGGLKLEGTEFSIEEVKTEQTKTTKPITIAGGPLATEEVKSIYPNGIPQGTDIQKVLEDLFCKIIFPSVTANTPTYSVTTTAPSISGSVSNGSLVEIGQIVNISQVKATNTVIDAESNKPVVKTFEHGYSSTLSGDINTGKQITTEWTVSQKEETEGNENKYKLSVSVTGFTGKPNDAENFDYSACTISACSLTASSGTNSYKVTQNGPTFVGTHTGISQYYIVSNTGTRDENEKSPAIEAVNSENPTEKTPSATASTFSVTGVYPIYTNGVGISDINSKPSTDDSYLQKSVGGDGTKLKLINPSTGVNTTNRTLLISFAAHTKEEGYIVYLPADYKIKKASFYNTTSGFYDYNYTSYFVNKGTTSRTVQNKVVTYNVYEFLEKNGANWGQFIFEK